MTDTIDRELGWDDEIEQEGTSFVTLPAGEYDFEVIDFERERHPGSEKLPPCNKAVVEIKIDGGEQGTATIKENLFLHTKTEGILSAFFVSIGQRQHGEKFKMDWGKVRGAKGRAKVKIRQYQKDGEDRTINQVQAWLEPKSAAPAVPYTPGQFG